MGVKVKIKDVKEGFKERRGKEGNRENESDLKEVRRGRSKGAEG